MMSPQTPPRSYNNPYSRTHTYASMSDVDRINAELRYNRQAYESTTRPLQQIHDTLREMRDIMKQLLDILTDNNNGQSTQG